MCTAGGYRPRSFPQELLVHNHHHRRMESQNTPNTLSDVDAVDRSQSSYIQENNGGSNQGRSVESTHPQTSADSQAQQYEDNDIIMDFDDYNEMPSLQDVSDSSDSEGDSDSDRDANEVEMQVDNTDDNEGRPPLSAAEFAPLGSSSSNSRPSPFQTTVRTNSNRRARVDDDGDDERDRRHPSQRINSGNGNDSSATSSSSQTPAQVAQNHPNVQTNQPSQGPSTQRPTQPFHHHIIRATLSGNIDPNNHPFRFFRHLVPTDNNNANNTLGQNNNPPVPDNNNGRPQPQPQQPQPQGGTNNGRSMFEGLAFSVEIGPAFHIHPGQDQAGEPGAQNVEGQTPPGGNLPPRTGTFTDILSMLGRLGGGADGEAILNLGALGLGLGMPQEKDDPERAKRLVDGLEEVPVGLVRRLERVGGAAGGEGEEPANGGDAGCAICWDKLLDSDGEGFGKEERVSNGEEDKEEGTSSQTMQGSSQPKIVSLPCAHVFHADCLLPWFARPRHTTCPTCRFNIDPEDLTHASMRRRRERRERNPAQPAGQSEGEDLDEGDGPQPAVHIIEGDDFLGPHHVGDLFAPQADAQFQNLRQFFGPPNGQQNSGPHPGPADAATNVANPATAGSSSTANPTPLSIPATATTTSTAATTTPAPRLSGATSTTIQTPHGRVGILQVPIPVMVPFVLPNTAPGQTPTSGAALNNPNGAPPSAHTAEITRLLQRIMGRGGQQPAQPQVQGGQANPQVSNAAGTAHGGALPAPHFFGGNSNPGSQSGTPNLPAAANTPVQGEHIAPNAPGAGINQLPQNLRQGVMEIRVDMVFGGDPFTGQFLGGNRQGGQAAGAGDVNDFLANDIEAAANAAAESGDPVHAAHVARHRELEQRLSHLVEMRQHLDAQAAAFGAQLPTQQPEGQADPQQQQHLPLGNLAGLAAGPGMHFTGTGRSVSEAFARMFGGMHPTPPQGQGQPAPGANPEAEGGQQNAPPEAEGVNHIPHLPQPFQMPPTGHGAAFNLFPNLADVFGGAMPERRRPRPYKEWTLPPPPGPTLRQRIERREREAGLRCYDVSCGIGPSDEDPLGTEIGEAAAGLNQLSIMSKVDRSELCPHTFHGPCLVSAERVSLRGADAVVENGNVEVSCPVCRGTGCVSKKDWDEGVVSLQ